MVPAALAALSPRYVGTDGSVRRSATFSSRRDAGRAASSAAGALVARRVASCVERWSHSSSLHAHDTNVSGWHRNDSVRSPPSPGAHAREDAHSNAGDSGSTLVIFESAPPRRDDGSSASPNRAAEILTVTDEGASSSSSSSTTFVVDAAAAVSRRERLPPDFLRSRLLRSDPPSAPRVCAAGSGGTAHVEVTPSAGQNPRAPPSRATSLQLASGTPRMFTHCPTPSAAGGHAHRHDPVRPPFGSASRSSPSCPDASTPRRRTRAAASAPVAATSRSACCARAAASASCLCAAASAPFSPFNRRSRGSFGAEASGLSSAAGAS